MSHHQQHPQSPGQQADEAFANVWRLITNPQRRQLVLLAEAARLRAVLSQRVAELRASAQRLQPGGRADEKGGRA